MHRKIWIFFFIFFLILSKSYAQTTSAMVLDEETRKPLFNAVIRNLTDPVHVTFTDTTGSFSIQALPDHIVEISYLGYVSQHCKAITLDKHQCIYLELSNRELQDVTVVADNYGYLLEKGLSKLKERILTDTSLIYLWHGIVATFSTKDSTESYAKYSTITRKKKKKLTNELRLFQVRHVHQITDNSIALRSKLLNTGYHPTFEEEELETAKIKKEEIDDKIVLTRYLNPEEFDGTDLIKYILSKKDTIVQAAYFLTVDSSYLKQNTVYTKKDKFRLIHRQASIIFGHTKEEDYYIQQAYHSVVWSVDIKGKRELVRNINTTTMLEGEIAPKNKGEKITGWSRELFKKQSNTTVNFWNNNF